MKQVLHTILILTVIFSIQGCNENSQPNELRMKIDYAGIDTLDGLEFAYRINIDNSSKMDINFYPGLDQSENLALDGFYLNFNKLGKSYQMTSLIKSGLVIIPAHGNKKFIIHVCFREYCKNISDFAMIYDTYYKSKIKLESIKKLIKDISIEYRINKTWNNKSYRAVFKNDSIIYFNRLDTIDTKFYSNITGNTFKEILCK